MPFVEQENYELSQKCKLHPGNDIFREQEEHKIHVDVNEWRCGYCKKSFRAEKFLDQHFDNRHSNLLNVVCAICFSMFMIHYYKILDQHFDNMHYNLLNVVCVICFTIF